MTRKDNVEYFNGRSMFKTGCSHEDCPYPRNLKKDSRYRRWMLGWFDEQAEARENKTL